VSGVIYASFWREAESNRALVWIVVAIVASGFGLYFVRRGRHQAPRPPRTARRGFLAAAPGDIPLTAKHFCVERWRDEPPAVASASAMGSQGRIGHRAVARRAAG